MNRARFTPSFNRVLSQQAHSMQADGGDLTVPNSGSLICCH